MKTFRQLFDYLARFVSPRHRAGFEQLGRRLDHLKPDDEILMILLYVAIHTNIGVNTFTKVRVELGRLLRSNRILFQLLGDLRNRLDGHQLALRNQAKNQHDLLVKELVERQGELMRQLVEQMKWLKLIFILFIGQSILLGILVVLFETVLGASGSR